MTTHPQKSAKKRKTGANLSEKGVKKRTEAKTAEKSGKLGAASARSAAKLAVKSAVKSVSKSASKSVGVSSVKSADKKLVDKKLGVKKSAQKSTVQKSGGEKLSAGKKSTQKSAPKLSAAKKSEGEKLEAKKSGVARVMYAADAADMRYATGLEAGDPFVWLQDAGGKTHILTSSLEIEHAKRDARVEYVHEYGHLAKEMEQKGLDAFRLPNMIFYLASQAGGKTGGKAEVGGKTGGQSVQGQKIQIEVPADFPVGLAQALEKGGAEILPVPEPFFPARSIKTKAEIAGLREAQRVNELGMRRAVAILSAAEVGKGQVLMWQGSVLTSEILQAEVNTEIVRHGGVGFNSGSPIAAGGPQGADPHERGHGPLKAGEFIVLDTFPRHKNGFNGDMTRTFFKGKMSGWHQEMLLAVKETQALCFSMIKEGVNGADIQKAAEEFFAKRGFETGVDDQGRYYGFFHSIGHGVGLEVHDFPRVGLEVHDFPQGTISRRECVLKAGMVTSVEPGLYYPTGHYGKNEFGGVRIEDVVAVTKTGYDSLNTLPAILPLD